MMMRVKIHYDDLDRAKYIHCTPYTEYNASSAVFCLISAR